MSIRFAISVAIFLVKAIELVEYKLLNVTLQKLCLLLYCLPSYFTVRFVLEDAFRLLKQTGSFIWLILHPDDLILFLIQVLKVSSFTALHLRKLLFSMP